jgi:hypothetical protein
MKPENIEKTKRALIENGFQVSHGPVAGTLVALKQMGTPWQKVVLIQPEEGTGVVNVHVHLRRHDDSFNPESVIDYIEKL